MQPDAKIEHVFVLMLENRSFDHLLGFSGLTGRDAETGGQTAVSGPPKGAQNVFQGTPYPAIQSAQFSMAVDPLHEFADVVQQLCGHGVTYPARGEYPPTDNSGFVASYFDACTAAQK